MRFSLSILAFVLIFSACGGSTEPPAETESTPETEMSAGDMTAMGTSSISGTVMFEGEAPERTPVRVNEDCMEFHDNSFPMSETVLVNDGALQNTFVYVSAGLPDGYAYPVPSEPAVLDQEGCLYVPHVMGIQVDQKLRIENSDPFQHNVHPTPAENRGFNESTPGEGDFLEKDFRVPEVMVPVKCDVHAWMLAYIGVLDHPYFATSAADGTFMIEGLPAGTYTVTTWHEEFGTQEMQVTVGDGETAQADYTYSSAS